MITTSLWKSVRPVSTVAVFCNLSGKSISKKSMQERFLKILYQVGWFTRLFPIYFAHSPVFERLKQRQCLLYYVLISSHPINRQIPEYSPWCKLATKFSNDKLSSIITISLFYTKILYRVYLCFILISKSLSLSEFSQTFYIYAFH